MYYTSYFRFGLIRPVVHGAIGFGKQSFKLVWWCHQLLPGFPSVASVTSVANDKGDNEMILGLGTDLLEFALQLRKTPENLS